MQRHEKNAVLDCAIIIIGGNHHNTLGVVRALGQKGISPFVIIIGKTRNSFVLKSKYVADGLILPSAEDAVSYLMDKYANHKRVIVFSCSDGVTCALDQHYNDLKDVFLFFNGKEQGRLSRLTNKYKMQQLAIACGLQIPSTKRVVDGVLPEGIVYPCVTKDVDNINGSKHDMKVFENETELLGFLRHRQGVSDILVQQFIDKEMEFQLIGCSVRNTNGEYNIIIPGHTKILRSQPVTNTGFLEYYSNEGFEYNKEACRRFIEACCYTGLFSLEFIRDKNGIDYFLEINFRNDGNAYVVTKAGVNLPFIYYLSSIGEDYTYEANRPIKTQVSMPVVKDFKTVIQGKTSLISWLKDLKRTNCFFYKDKEDPKPMMAYFKELICAVNE